MTGKFTLSREQFVSLLDKSLFPNPEGGPIGPGGPVIRTGPTLSLRHVNINPPNPPDPLLVFDPGPIPWMHGPQPEPWRHGPQPDPWRVAVLTATALDRSLQALQLAKLISNDKGENAIIVVGGKLKEVAEELCPTPPKFPFPWPHPHGLNASELFAAGLVFQRAADSIEGAELRSNLIESADLLFQTGINRLEEQTQKALGASA